MRMRKLVTVELHKDDYFFVPHRLYWADWDNFLKGEEPTIRPTNRNLYVTWQTLIWCWSDCNDTYTRIHLN